MSIPPSERNFPPSPESREQILKLKFRLATGAIVNHMRIMGGDPFLPRRKEPNKTYVTVREVRGENITASLDLYSSGMWAGNDHEGYFQPIGMVDDVTIDHLLPVYAHLTSDELNISVNEAIGESQLNDMADLSKPLEERQAAYREKAEPIVDRFVAEHREELMEGLVQDIARALSTVIRAPLTDTNENPSSSSPLPDGVETMTVVDYHAQGYPSKYDREFAERHARRILENAQAIIKDYETTQGNRAPSKTIKQGASWYRKTAQTLRQRFRRK